MTCNQTPKTIVSFPKPPATPAPIGLTGSQSAVGTRFLISDNPETINSTTTTFTNGFATLWSDTSTGNSTVRYRAFLWHYNNTGASIKVGITMGNAGASSYSIHNLNNAIQVVPIGQISLGICAAASLAAFKNLRSKRASGESSLTHLLGKIGSSLQTTITCSFSFHIP